MKTRNFLTAVIFVVMFFIFSGCSDTRNNDNYSFWKQENQLRFFISIPKLGQYNNESLINEIGDLELPEEYQKRVDKLKKAMISYFKEEYKIDISSKIENQKLRVFYSKGVVETTMGYVDPQKPETLNLNQILFTEFMELFDNTYVHETLHQIGFRSKKISIIDEGVTDALTDLILQKAKIESVTTDIYYEARMLAYQLIKADKDLIKFYLENDSFQIQDRINEKLSKVSRPFEDRDPGIFLDKMLSGLTNGVYGINPYYIAFQAQEIVRSYCQTFNPSNDSIDYIREHYLVEAYEETLIEYNGDAYNFSKSE